jgi:hypothetical protein
VDSRWVASVDVPHVDVGLVVRAVKRSGPLRRTSPLEGRGGSLSRKTPLRIAPAVAREFAARARRNSRPPEPLPPLVRAEAMRRCGGRCVMCGVAEVDAWPRRLDPHHVWPKRLFPELAVEPRNIVMMDRQCHMTHEFSPLTRLPRAKLPMDTLALATAHPDREAFLERTYP